MDIFEFLFSPYGMGIIAAGVVFLLSFMLIRRLRPVRQVLYLRERDRRGQTLPIVEETSIALTCPGSRRSPAKRFFKWGGSYVFSEGGKMVTKFLGKEGTAYTYKPWTGEEKNNLRPSLGNGSDKPRTITEEVQCSECGKTFPWEVEIPESSIPGGVTNIIGQRIGGLWDAIQSVCGKKFCDEFPEKQQAELEKSNIFVTVDLEPGLTPEGFSPISEDEVNEEQDRGAAKIFGQGLGATVKTQLYMGMLWMSLGALLVFIMFMMTGKIV